MIPRLYVAASVGVITAASLSLPLLAQKPPDSGPVARYDMRAGTVSGMGSMTAGGGMGAMSRMFGGGGDAQHELWLRLGSSQGPAQSKAEADHFMPSGARLGKSVKLVTPVSERGPADELPGDMSGERPKGRILLYWGCGEHAPQGQPVVIDLANLSAGQAPPDMWTSRVLRDWGPTLENSKTFGRWPADDGKSAKPDSSLLGAHRVASNYGPEIAFSLSKDFMAPLSVKAGSGPGGSIALNWRAIPDATGYHVYLFGGKQGPGGEMGDMVMWTSSASRDFGGGLSDWLSPAQVSPLVRDNTVLAPATTSCLVPAEVKRDAPDFRFGTLAAFGPEENFSYPPRPADANARWDLQWTARIRHRSTTSWMEAQGMSMGMADDESEAQEQECKPKRGLGGLLGGVLPGSNGC